jgi:FimV-like protein
MKYTIVSQPSAKRSNFLLPVAILLGLVLVSFRVNALIPGELEILSSDREPLRAQLALTQVTIPPPDRVRVTTAPKSTYLQAGLTQDDYLSQLEFTVSPITEDRLLVQITAPQPLNKTTVDVLLQFETADQLLIRYYRLAPRYSLGAGLDQDLTAADKPVHSDNQRLKILGHRVVEGDTLWNIAKRLRPQGMSIAQAMDQLYTANPDAFLDADSTQIKKGSLLTLIPAPISEPDKTDLPLDTALSIPRVELTDSTANPPRQLQAMQDPQLAARVEQVIQAGPAELEETAELEKVEEEKVEEEKVEEEKVEQADVTIVTDQPKQVNNQIPAEPAQLDIQEPNKASHLIATALQDQTDLVPQQPLPQSIKAPISGPETQPVDPDQLAVPQHNLLNWQFPDISGDNRQRIIALGILAFAVILILFLLLRRLFKGSANTQIAQPAQASDDNLAASVLNGPFSGDANAEQSIFTDLDNQPRADKPAPAELEAEDQQIADTEVAFPGLQELEAQMGKQFSAQQTLSGGTQIEDNALDMETIDPLQVRLDMATICMETNDIEAAREILQEIILEADESGKSKAQAMLDNLDH